MRVQLTIDDETVVGELLSSPNAIGIVTIRVAKQDLQRHVNRIRALDTDAGKLLGSATRFVSRDPETIVEQVITPETSRPKDWTIEDLNLLRMYTAAALVEAANGPRHGKRKQRYNKIFLVHGVVKNWLKQSRMNQTSIEANLTEEEAKDPICLLRASMGVMIKLCALYRDETGNSILLEERRVIDVVRNYLNHCAGVSPIS